MPPCRLRLSCLSATNRRHDAGSGASISNCILLTGCSSDQPPRMQGNSRGKRPRAAILAIAHNRKAGVRQLHANLVLAAGERAHFQQRWPSNESCSCGLTRQRCRSLSITAAPPICAPGVFAAHVACTRRCRSSLRRKSISRPSRRLDSPFDDRPIDLLDVALAKLLRQPPRRLRRSRQQHDARHRRIEPAHDSQDKHCPACRTSAARTPSPRQAATADPRPRPSSAASPACSPPADDCLRRERRACDASGARGWRLGSCNSLQWSCQSTTYQRQLINDTSPAPSPQPQPLILASSSPRRRELLAEAGYEFAVVAAAEDVECGVCSESGPAGLVAELAYRKAAAVVDSNCRKMPTVPGMHAPARPVPSSSPPTPSPNATASSSANRATKPTPARCSRQLSGREHRVLTGVCALWPTWAIK